jgi:hypothetical protein
MIDTAIIKPFFIIRKISTNYVSTEENFDLNSDHTPVILTMSENVIKKKPSLTLVNKKTDWVKFQEDISSSIQLKVPLRTIEQLNQEAENIMEQIQQAARKNTPEIKRLLAGNNYPMEIRQLVTEKRKLSTRWQQIRAPEDNNRLNNRTQRLRREILKWKNESMNKYLSEPTDHKVTDYSLWKVTKRMKLPRLHNPPIRTLAKDNQQES